MRVHYLQHAPEQDFGNMRPWFEQNNWIVSSTHLYRDEPLPALDSFDWLVVMGGGMSAYDDDKVSWLKEEKAFLKKAIAENKTIIGICLGAQLLASVLGARVYRAPQREIGWHKVERAKELPPQAAPWLPPSGTYLHWHNDMFDLPTGAQLLGSSAATSHQGFLFGDRIVALQFHLEALSDTPKIFCAAGGLPAADTYVQSWEQAKGSDALFAQSRQVMTQLLDHLASSLAAE